MLSLFDFLKKMSTLSTHTFYPDLSFGGYLLTDFAESNSGSSQGPNAATDMSDNNYHLQLKGTENTFNKDFAMFPFPVKIEETEESLIGNCYTPTIEEINNTVQYSALLDSNCSLYQQQTFSPCPSYSSTHSSLDIFCNENSNNSALDYFMSASPSTTYSLLTPPAMPQDNCSIDLCYNDTVNNNMNYFDYHYLATEYPLISTEILPCYNAATNCFPTTATKPLLQSKSNSDHNSNHGFKIGSLSKKCSKKSKPSEPLSPVINESFNTDDINASLKKIYPCNYCKRSFSRRYDVTRHERTHTGVKPYVCPCCLKGFSRSDARVRHYRTEIACRDGAERLGRHRTQKLHHNKF